MEVEYGVVAGKRAACGGEATECVLLDKAQERPKAVFSKLALN